MARLFLSYATPDSYRAHEVYDWLVAEGHVVFFDRDADRGVAIGEDWKRRLYRELARVDAVVCLVTPAYLESKWCAAEVAIADARLCPLMPLRFEPDLVHEFMKLEQYAIFDADPHEAHRQLRATLRQLDAGGQVSWRDGDNPYPGLEPFTAGMCDLFFGRTREKRELAARLRDEAGRGVLAVVGPSGCGKSSLLRAGLLPLLGQENPDWIIVDPWQPGQDPMRALAMNLATAAARVGVDWAPGMIRQRLETTDGLRDVAEELLARPPGVAGRRLVIAIDQAEELFTRTTDSGRRAGFGAVVNGAVAGPVRVVITLRSEYLDDFAALPHLTAGSIDTYLLGPLAQDMVRLAIEQPARIAGLNLEPELVARLVTDTGSGNALPLLAFTLRQLAHGRGRGDKLTVAAYEELGAGDNLSGLDAVLVRRADATLATAAARSGLTTGQVLAGLVRLVSLDDGGRRARRRVDRGSLPVPMREAFEEFANQRLLTTDGDSVEVAHEAMLSAWPPLDEAITARAEALRAARSVEQAAAEWAEAADPDIRLWNENLVTAVAKALNLPTYAPGATEPVVDLDPRAHDFLTASRARNLARGRRQRRIATGAISTLAALLVVAIVAIVVAVVQGNTASRQRDASTVRAMILEATVQRTTQPRLSAMLVIAALRLDPASVEARAALLATLAANHLTATLYGHADAVRATALSPDGTRLAAASHDHTVSIWDMRDPDHPVQQAVLNGHTDWVTAVAWSPDGTRVAAGGKDKTVWVWDVRAPDRGDVLRGHDESVDAVAWNSDGTRLATGSHDGTAKIWDVRHPARAEPQAVLSEHAGPVHAVAWNTDGTRLATGSHDATAMIWDVTDPGRAARVGTLARHWGQVYAVAWNHDGSRLATGGGWTDNRVIVWDVTDQANPVARATLEGHTNEVSSVAWSPDGVRLASGSHDRTVAVWNLRDLDRPEREATLTGHTDGVYAVAWSPDGVRLTSGSTDHTVAIWNLHYPAHPDRATTLTGHRGELAAVAWSPDGAWLATGGTDRAIGLWYLDSTKPPTLLAEHAEWVDELAWSPDGTRLASASYDRTVRIWDMRDPLSPKPLPTLEHTAEVTALAWSPDSTHLASGGFDGTVRIWDMRDPGFPVVASFPNPNWVRSVAWSPLGSHIATGDHDGTVAIWNVRAPDDSPTRVRGAGPIAAVSWSPDGRRLASGDMGGAVNVWLVANGTAAPQAVMTDHFDDVFAVAWSPDSSHLASGGADRRVIIWDMRTPDHPVQAAAPLSGHTNAVSALTWSPNGTYLASGSDDHTVIIWDSRRLTMSNDEALLKACTMAGRALSADEWRQYVPGIAYRDTCDF